jgi:membrane protease YdiL (CAAX protease family)
MYLRREFSEDGPRRIRVCKARTVMSIHPAAHAAQPKNLLYAAFACALALGVWAEARLVLAQLDAATVTLLKVLIVAPVVEEFFFRGFVHAGLLTRGGVLGRPLVAIGITALGFGAAHLWLGTWVHAAAVTLPALAIGCVYQRTRSVWACVALHVIFNLMSITWG